MVAKPAGPGAVNADREAVHQAIQAAIAAELEKRGLKRVNGPADVQVGYLVIVGDNATTATYDDYFGYGRDAAALTQKAHKALSGKSARDYFEVGAIVVDVVETRTTKLLFRSYAYSDIQNVTPQNRVEHINRLVASCLGDLRVAH